MTEVFDLSVYLHEHRENVREASWIALLMILTPMSLLALWLKRLCRRRILSLEASVIYGVLLAAVLTAISLVVFQHNVEKSEDEAAHYLAGSLGDSPIGGYVPRDAVEHAWDDEGWSQFYVMQYGMESGKPPTETTGHPSLTKWELRLDLEAAEGELREIEKWPTEYEQEGTQE